MPQDSTELLVIGAGPAGYLAAIRAAQLDLEVILVERRDSLGGVCLNEGCIPSKALIHAANLYHESTSSGDMGMDASADIDHGKLQEWKDGVVKKLTSGVEILEKKNGVEIVKGEAHFESPREVTVAESTSLAFDNCIIAMGSSPVEIPSIPIDGETVLTSREILDLESVPARLLVVGGGYIGMEMGMAYSKFGSDVTVLEASDHILPGNPPELVSPVERRAEDLGIDIRTGSRAEEADISGGKAVVKTDRKGEIEADAVLVAVGRVPNTGSLGLEEAGVETDGDGFVKVSGRRQTSRENIYAIGDVAGNPMLAHKGYQEGKIVPEMIAGERPNTDFHVPAVIYTDPEMASVGLTEGEAEDEGYTTITGKFPLSASGRAATMNRSDGLVKVVADGESKALLGVHITGPHASEMIPEATLALEMGALLPDILMTVHPHPTLSEAFREACEDALGEAIHRYNPK